MIDLETFAEPMCLCFLSQTFMAKYLLGAQRASVLPLLKRRHCLSPQLERWVKKVVARSNRAKKSFGAYGPQCVVQVQQLGECPAGRLLLALQQQFIIAWRFDGSGTPCLNWPRLETCISVQLGHKGLGLCLSLKEDIYQKITRLMELSDPCLRVARDWINRAGILAGVECWQSRDLSLGRQHPPGLGGYSHRCGGTLWGYREEMICWQRWRHKSLGLCLDKNTGCDY